jgi:tetratricopeptide (TPR) repeat protein
VHDQQHIPSVSRAHLCALLLIFLLFFLNCGRSRAIAEEGLARLEQGKQTSALEHFDRALRDKPDEALALYGKGMLLSEELITEQIALSMLTQAVQLPTLGEKYRIRAYLKISEIYAQRGLKDDAVQNLAKISGTQKFADGRHVRRVAAIYLKLKEKDRAREALSAYLEANPQDEETDLYLERLYSLELKDSKSAAKRCASIDWQKSQLARYLLTCTKITAAQGDFARALVLIDLYIKKAGSTVTKEINDLREAITRKRGRFDVADSDF